MKPVVFALAALAVSPLVAADARAQHVVADIHVRQGPVSGHIIVGHPPVHVGRTIIVVGPRYHTRHGYHRIAVHRGHRGHGWYRRHGYRAHRVWYDPREDCYYDRADRHGRLRAVVVYERGGRYYRDQWRDDDRYSYENRDGRRHVRDVGDDHAYAARSH